MAEVNEPSDMSAEPRRFDISSIDRLAGVLHDLALDVPSINRDSHTNTLTFSLRREDRKHQTRIARRLVGSLFSVPLKWVYVAVTNVQSVDTSALEGLDGPWVSSVFYDDQNRVIHFATEASPGLAVQVDEPEIEVVVTDDDAGERRLTRYFGSFEVNH